DPDAVVRELGGGGERRVGDGELQAVDEQRQKGEGDDREQEHRDHDLDEAHAFVARARLAQGGEPRGGGVHRASTSLSPRWNGMCGAASSTPPRTATTT